jgi:hypothetical protein
MHRISIEQAYRNLADAIIIQASDDYRNALNGKTYNKKSCHTPEGIIKECERFFHSSWYHSLTKIDGDFIIEQLQREHNEKVRKEKESCELN